MIYVRRGYYYPFLFYLSRSAFSHHITGFHVHREHSKMPYINAPYILEGTNAEWINADVPIPDGISIVTRDGYHRVGDGVSPYSALPVLYDPSLTNPDSYTNFLDNSAFEVWQRGTSITATKAVATHTADRWLFTGTGANTTIVQNTTARTAGTPSSGMRINGASGLTGAILTQRIEGYRAESLDGGMTSTIDFWLYNNTSSAFSPQLTLSCPISTRDVFSSVTSFISSQSLGTCPVGTWTRLSFTTIIPVACIRGLQVSISFGASLNGSSKYILLSEMHLTKSNVVVPYNKQHHTQLMVTCERYFRRVRNGITGYVPSNKRTTIIASLSHHEMRAAPSISQNGLFIFDTMTNTIIQQSSAGVTIRYSDPRESSVILLNFPSIENKSVLSIDPANSGELWLSAEL